MGPKRPHMFIIVAIIALLDDSLKLCSSAIVAYYCIWLASGCLTRYRKRRKARLPVFAEKGP
ncbi:MAG: hypothetical protein B7Z26_07635 [Asticcacaulis sp. 32-58-5]|nr:MAG: hypothetical protein B7Z26_07635 [Asticcacaulis sp. 32-58-5]